MYRFSAIFLLGVGLLLVMSQLEPTVEAVQTADKHSVKSPTKKSPTFQHKLNLVFDRLEEEHPDVDEEDGFAADMDMPFIELDPGLSILSGWVQYPDGTLVEDARVVSDNCPISVRVIDGFFQTDLFGDSCRIQARRLDGSNWTRSEWLEVSLEQGEEKEVELFLPEEKTAGLGLEFWEHPDGFELLNAYEYENQDGQLISLQPGDVITEIDGVPASSMSFIAFMEATSGVEGSDVSLSLSRETEDDWVDTEISLSREIQDGPYAEGDEIPSFEDSISRHEAAQLYHHPEIDPELWEELMKILEKDERLDVESGFGR